MFGEEFDCPSGHGVEMTVTDTGVGMNKEVLLHLFEPFYTTKKKGEWVDHGLSAVYNIVKQNRGAVEVFSLPGEGATFKIYLPCVDAGGKRGR